MSEADGRTGALDTETGDATVAGTLSGSRRRGGAAEPRRGEQVGRYLILDRVGAGGMGVVYAAYDPELDRKIAIKLLHADAGSEPAAEGHHRLLREAQALARLAHPNVIAVHDVGEHEGRIFLAMEFIEGETLGGWLLEPRSKEEILAAFTAAGRGLAAAPPN